MIGAQADPYVEREVWKGWRVPNVKVPGVRFYVVLGLLDKTLVIRLNNETHERLITVITEVEDPVEVAENINEAVGA